MMECVRAVSTQNYKPEKNGGGVIASIKHAVAALKYISLLG